MVQHETALEKKKTIRFEILERCTQVQNYCNDTWGRERVCVCCLHKYTCTQSLQVKEWIRCSTTSDTPLISVIVIDPFNLTLLQLSCKRFSNPSSYAQHIETYFL